jgi:hypothetical protein
MHCHMNVKNQNILVMMMIFTWGKMYRKSKMQWLVSQYFSYFNVSIAQFCSLTDSSNISCQILYMKSGEGTSFPTCSLGKNMKAWHIQAYAHEASSPAQFHFHIPLLQDHVQPHRSPQIYETSTTLPTRLDSQITMLVTRACPVTCSISLLNCKSMRVPFMNQTSV